LRSLHFADDAYETVDESSDDDNTKSFENRNYETSESDWVKDTAKDFELSYKENQINGN